MIRLPPFIELCYSLSPTQSLSHYASILFPWWLCLKGIILVKSERSLYTEPSLKGNGRSWSSPIHLSQKCTHMHIFLFLDITVCDSKGDPDSLFGPRRHLGRKMMMVPDAPGGLEYLVWLRPNAHCLKIPVMPPTPITRTKEGLSHKKWQILSHYILSDKIQTHVSDPIHPFSFCIQVILSGYYEIFLWTECPLVFNALFLKIVLMKEKICQI